MKTPHYKQITSFFDLFEDLEPYCSIPLENESYANYELHLTNKLSEVSSTIDYRVKFFTEDDTNYSESEFILDQIEDITLMVEDYEIELMDEDLQMLELIIKKTLKQWT